jgi:hypothetical protein
VLGPCAFRHELQQVDPAQQLDHLQAGRQPGASLRPMLCNRLHWLCWVQFHLQGLGIGDWQCWGGSRGLSLEGLSVGDWQCWGVSRGLSLEGLRIGDWQCHWHQWCHSRLRSMRSRAGPRALCPLPPCHCLAAYCALLCSIDASQRFKHVVGAALEAGWAGLAAGWHDDVVHCSREPGESECGP